jgi:hypothetical protein
MKSDDTRDEPVTHLMYEPPAIDARVEITAGLIAPERVGSL